MIPVLLIFIPLLAGIATFFFRNEKAARSWALASTLVVLLLSVLGLTVITDAAQHSFKAAWLGNFGSSFSVGLDGMGQLLTLLTAIGFPVILLATWHSTYAQASRFFGLLLLSQAGLMGVFLAMDALLFYFFWELALIPVYFLCSQWGGERRIAVTFKFFIYTFIGSLLMLIGIIYIYSKTSTGSFAIEDFYAAALTPKQQDWIFLAFFLAFAIKMPVFPFHSWQPDTYEQSPTAVTMVLSGIMVKMGVFGLIRWLLPLVPFASYQRGDNVMTLAVVGMVYASLIAIRQNDIKRLVAYSSIAHIGLMAAAVFAVNEMAMQGVMIQMFSHGVNIIGMWIVVEIIERNYGTRKISDLGGLAQKAPAMAILFLIVAFANIALPLTNAFVGEFLMFTGIFNSDATQFSVWYTVIAGVCIILAAVYTLNMVRKTFYGETVAATASATDLKGTEKLALVIIVILIFAFGVYPKPMLELTESLSRSVVEAVTSTISKK